MGQADAGRGFFSIEQSWVVTTLEQILQSVGEPVLWVGDLMRTVHSGAVVRGRDLNGELIEYFMDCKGLVCMISDEVEFHVLIWHWCHQY